MATRKTIKNGKDLVDLLEITSHPSMRTLASVEEFSFLVVPAYDPHHAEPALAESLARSSLLATLPAHPPDKIAVANNEAIRITQLTGFRVEALLTHAHQALEFDDHPDLAEFDPSSDAISRLIWLRAKAPLVFEQIETIFLTHHFHGHKKFTGYSVRNGAHTDFVWSDEIAASLHEAITKTLGLDTSGSDKCELIHFEMDDEDPSNRLHYLVVYHPGKMRTLRQMVENRRDLLRFVPALEATLVYDAASKQIHVLCPRPTIASRLAEDFSRIGFDHPLSNEPLEAIYYDLSMFHRNVDLASATATGALIEEAWVSSLTVSLGHTSHSVSFELKSQEDIWVLATQHFGTHDPLSSSRSVKEVKLSFRIRFDGDAESKALNITIDERGQNSLLAVPDPRLRRCGEEILVSCGIMNRVAPVDAGTDIDLLKAELALLDLDGDTVDGHLLKQLRLSAPGLVSAGLLRPKPPGKHITVPIVDEEGHHGFRQIEVAMSSTSTWAYDELSDERYSLDHSDITRYSVNRAYLRERLSQLLGGQLVDTPLTEDDAEPYFLGYYSFGEQRTPIVLVSRLWNAKRADQLDATLRTSGLGLPVVLTTTFAPSRRYLGPGIVIPVHALLTETPEGVSIDLSRARGELARRQAAAASINTPELIKEDAHTAILRGPWPEPWVLTKGKWVDIVEALVNAWNTGQRKMTRQQLEIVTGSDVRNIPDAFRGAPEWTTYIRGAERATMARSWELAIGPASYAAAFQNVDAENTESTEALETP